MNFQTRSRLTEILFRLWFGLLLISEDVLVLGDILISEDILTFGDISILKDNLFLENIEIRKVWYDYEN